MPGRLLRRSSLRWLATHPWMLFLSVLGVAVGVSVVVGIDLANTSAERAFRASTESVAGRATHAVTGGPTGVPDSVFVRFAREHPDIPAAPILEFWAVTARASAETTAQSTAETIHVLGVDVFSEPPFRPFTATIGRSPGGTQGAQEANVDAPFDLAAFLSGRGGGWLAPQTATRLGLAPNDTLRLNLDGRRVDVPVAGLIPTSSADGPEASLDGLFVVDVSTAKRLLGYPSGLTRVDLILEPGNPDMAEQIRAGLPAGLQLDRSESRTETLAQMTAAFELNLTALSLLALVVGMFLTWNTISFSVVQRRALIGRLRAMGVRRHEILQLILGEAVVIGLAGTALGLLLGVFLGQGLVQLVTRTINDLYFVVSVRDLHLAPLTLAKGIGLGLGATLVAAWLPGRQAASEAPTTLLARSSDESRMTGRIPRLTGVGLLLLGLGATILLVSGRSIALAYGGIFSIIMGWALVSPALISLAVRVGVGPAARVGGVIGRMAVGSIRANLSRTSVAIAALSIAIASVIGVGVMVGSFRTTVVTWLEGALQADIYIQAPGSSVRSGGAGLDAAVVADIRTTPGVQSSHGIRHAEVESSVGRVHVAAIETGPHSEGALAMKDGVAAELLPTFESLPSALISEPFAFRYGTARGDTLVLETPSGPVRVPVLGVYHDYASDRGTVMMHRRHYEALFNDPGLSGLALFVEDTDALAAVMDAVRARAAGRQELVIRSNRELRAWSLEIFDRTFTVTRVLQLLAVIVAFIGILSALMALQLERAREYAVLRATGMTGRQLGRFVAWQCGFMGLLAGLLAIPLGLVLSFALIFVINLRSFGWTLQLEADPVLLIQGLVIAVGAALVAGWWPVRLMRRMETAAALRSVMTLVVGVALSALLLAGCGPARPDEQSEGLSLSDALSVDIEGYDRAWGPRPLEFPRDHAAHDDFKLEWWYLTGNLEDAGGNRFGYQVTVFRNALAPPDSAGGVEGDWTTRQLYLTHVAITDASTGRHLSEERFVRGSAGLAGTTAEPFRVWAGAVDIRAGAPNAGIDTLTVRAPVGGGLLELDLSARKPIVLQGENGFSPKGDEPGNASYYYSLTRYAAAGTWTENGEATGLTGTGWMDREWSTSLLGRTQTGWDWFSIQLDDGRDLMYFRLRESDATAEPYTDGLLVDVNGSTKRLKAGDVEIEPVRTWTSPTSGATYPVAWTLRIPREGIALDLEPLLDDQEFDASIHYWEGAMRIAGSHAGFGYLEMTGYDNESR
ncbi:MAG: lipocalin-like domain-containing protein [Rhodothermales bacterium]